MQSDNFFLGLKLSEFITLCGIVIGPIIAVIITLLTEHYRKRREERMQILRFLLATRATPGDANYVGAVNLIPVYYNSQSNVMAAWRAYMDVVRFHPTTGDELVHDQKVRAKQAALIFSMMQALKLKLAETEIQTEAYISSGFVARDTAYLESLKAMPEIAAATKRSAETAEKMFEMLKGRS